MTPQPRQSAPAWSPPTPTPERGQGPWCDPMMGRWWVVADRVSEAFAAVQNCDMDAFPNYFGWRAIVEPVVIQWVAPEDWNEETEITEAQYMTDDTAEAWRISLEKR